MAAYTTEILDSSDDARVRIISSDKDLLQLVGPRVTVVDPVRNKEHDSLAVEHKFGIPPDRVPDLLALVGDSVDNVPGVPGFGVSFLVLPSFLPSFLVRPSPPARSV